MKQIILFIIVAAVLTVTGTKLTYGVTKKFELNQKELKCVKKLILKGVPRKDIKTGNGTCWGGSLGT